MMFCQKFVRETERDPRFLLQHPVLCDCLSGNVTRETYLALLEQAYHHGRHAVPLLMACGADPLE